MEIKNFEESPQKTEKKGKKIKEKRRKNSRN